MDERSKEILDRFSKSWNETEAFYDRLITDFEGFERLEPIRKFITHLRRIQSDSFFRLGTSMHALMISRSVNFGLRADQKYIKIEALDSSDFEVMLRDGDNIYIENTE